jgi:hypothetical protein
MMRSYSLTLGARQGRGGHWRSRDDQVVRQITEKHFPDGFTILRAAGGWFDPVRRRFIEESSRQVIVCTADKRKLRPWCRDLATALRQQELLLIEVGPARTFRFPGNQAPVRRKK